MKKLVVKPYAEPTPPPKLTDEGVSAEESGKGKVCRQSQAAAKGIRKEVI